jgi:hypothetical protein
LEITNNNTDNEKLWINFKVFWYYQ